MEILFIGLGFILHELFHIFLAIGGFAIVKKLWNKHKCCNHKHTENREE